MKHFPQLFQDTNREHITDKLEIANKFNNFFVNIGTKTSRQSK